jgi:hypothetical protein
MFKHTGIVTGTYNYTTLVTFVQVSQYFREVRRTQLCRSAAGLDLFGQLYFFHN